MVVEIYHHWICVYFVKFFKNLTSLSACFVKCGYNYYLNSTNMGLARTIFLIFAISIASSHAMGYYHPRIASGGCGSHTCGQNAKCTMTDGRPVCSCLNLHMGDALVHCHKVECIIDEDCSFEKACVNNHCIDPCAGFCGVNSNCDVRNHIATCSCPPGYTGNALTACHVADPQAACKPNPCGVNTHCEVINEVPICKCLPGYRGSPLGTGCRHECEIDSDCPSHLSCSSNFKCENPCNQCGEGATCDVINHRARCSCPANWLGNPYSGCRPECVSHSECPGNKPACLYQKCTNPCENACGVNANCELRGITPVCSCPRDMTGDPFVSCRPFEPEDLCKPNPCGLNAICTPGHDNTGKERPVCTCPPGYTGNALVNCRRGECLTDNECPDNRACIDYYCQNPCTGKECSFNAKCEARRHIAVCTCLPGTRGDPVVACNDIKSRSGYGRYYGGRYNGRK